MDQPCLSSWSQALTALSSACFGLLLALQRLGDLLLERGLHLVAEQHRRVVHGRLQRLGGGHPDPGLVGAVLLGEVRVVQGTGGAREDGDLLGEGHLVLRVGDEVREGHGGGLLLGLRVHQQAHHVHVDVPGVGDLVGDADVLVQARRLRLEVLQVQRAARVHGDGTGEELLSGRLGRGGQRLRVQGLGVVQLLVLREEFDTLGVVEGEAGAFLVHQLDAVAAEVLDGRDVGKGGDLAVGLPGDLQTVLEQFGVRLRRLVGVEPGLLEQGFVVEQRAGVEVPGERPGARQTGDVGAAPCTGQVLALVLRRRLVLVQVQREARLGERGGEVGGDVDDVGQGAAGRLSADLVGVVLGGLVHPLHVGARVLVLEVGDQALEVRLEVGAQVPGLEGDVALDLARGVARGAVVPGAAGGERQQGRGDDSGGEGSAGYTHGWAPSSGGPRRRCRPRVQGQTLHPAAEKCQRIRLKTSTRPEKCQVRWPDVSRTSVWA